MVEEPLLATAEETATVEQMWILKQMWILYTESERVWALES